MEEGEVTLSATGTNRASVMLAGSRAAA